MKKLHKILTLCLALIMLLGIMSVPASAVTGDYEHEYIVWTQDELFDLSIPRPNTDGRYVEIYIVPAEDGYDKIIEAIGFLSETRSKYIGRATCYIMDERGGDYNGNFPDEVLKAAREAYNRNTDSVWKRAIADAFYLDTKNSETPSTGTSTLTEPETPVTPVTPPATTAPTTTTKVTSFSDVKPGDWYYEAVMALANSGILAGYGDGRFGPNNTITAGELATIISRIYGVDLSQPVTRLPGKHVNHDDSTVNTGHWAESAIYNAAICTGSPNWRMCIANMEVNRGWAMGELAGALMTGVWPDGTKLSWPSDSEQKAIIASIPDVASGFSWKGTEDPSHYANYRLTTVAEFPSVATGEEVIAHDYMYMATYHCDSRCDLTAWDAGRIAYAYHIGLVNGVDSTGRCDPWAPVTRAQVVQMLYNMGITYAGQLTHESIDSDMIFGFGF